MTYRYGQANAIQFRHTNLSPETQRHEVDGAQEDLRQNLNRLVGGEDRCGLESVLLGGEPLRPQFGICLTNQVVCLNIFQLKRKILKIFSKKIWGCTDRCLPRADLYE